MVSARKGPRDTQKTVKAFESDIALINEHAKVLRCTAADVIHVMCEGLRKQAYLQEIGEALDLAVSDKKTFGEFEAEHAAWDCALSDGLDK